MVFSYAGLHQVTKHADINWFASKTWWYIWNIKENAVLLLALFQHSFTTDNFSSVLKLIMVIF